jgi:hypothetical protein
MTDTPSKRTFGEIVNTWVQTIGIIAAGIWAGYTFGYQQYKASTAPVNISVNLELKKIGPKSAANDKQDLIAVQMHTEATNPSTREIYLLKSAWFATGCDIGPARENPPFLEQAEDAVNDPQDMYAEQFSTLIPCSTIAAGHLYKDYALKPNEIIRRIIIFYVPINKYDEIKVEVLMPTSESREGYGVEWKPDNNGLQSIYYRLENGQRTNFSAGQNLDQYGLQQERSRATLSLWQ